MPPKAAAGKAAAAAPKKDAKKKEKKEEEKEERIPAPDKAAFEAQLEEVNKKIDDLMRGMTKISEEIKEQNAGSGEFNNKKNELMKKKSLLTEKIEEIMSVQTKLNGAITEKKETAAAMKNDVRKMQKNLHFSDEKGIDEEIARLEFRMLTSTIPLAEEKGILKQIAELKKNRPQIAKLKSMEQNIDSAGDTGVLKEQIQGNKADLGMFRDARSQVTKELSELINSRSDNFTNLKALYQKRDDARAEVEKLKEERTALRDAFKAEEREYNAKRREQVAARQRAMDERRAEDKAERDQKYREREADKVYEDDPNAEKIALVQQTVKWCQGLMPSEQAETAAAEKKEIQHDLPAGAEVLTKKEDRDEFYFVPTKAKKSKSKNKSEKAGSKAIKHNGVSFGFFTKLKLDAPLTTDDLPALLEKLQEMQADLAEKTKEWEATREETRRAILAGEIDPRSKKPAGAKKEAAAEAAAGETES